MKAVKFRLWQKLVGSDEPLGYEDHYERVNDPEAWCRDLIEGFNETLRPGEFPREVVRVEVGVGNATLKHDWMKTNLVTLHTKRDGYHDTYRCTACHGTGKRFGLAAVTPDEGVPRECPDEPLPPRSKRTRRGGER